MSLIFSPVKNASSSSTTSSVFQMMTLSSQEDGFRGLMSTFRLKLHVDNPQFMTLQ